MFPCRRAESNPCRRARSDTTSPSGSGGKAASRARQRGDDRPRRYLEDLRRRSLDRGEADDPTTALRSVAIDLAKRGLGRAGVEAVFVSVCEELADVGRDEESALVAYVLDMIAEW
jgi:hypothetical protein